MLLLLLLLLCYCANVPMCCCYYCYCAVLLCCCYATVLCCCCATVPLCNYATVSMCHCANVLLMCHCAPVAQWPLLLLLLPAIMPTSGGNLRDCFKRNAQSSSFQFQQTNKCKTATKSLENLIPPVCPILGNLIAVLAQ